MLKYTEAGMMDRQACGTTSRINGIVVHLGRYFPSQAGDAAGNSPGK